MQTWWMHISVESLINSLKSQRTTQERKRHCWYIAHAECGNLKVFSDSTTIISHMIVSGFVKYYTIWKKHGEMDVPPPTNNPLDEITEVDDFGRMFDAYCDFDPPRWKTSGMPRSSQSAQPRWRRAVHVRSNASSNRLTCASYHSRESSVQKKKHSLFTCIFTLARI